MRTRMMSCLLAAAVAASCGSPRNQHTYTLQGQVLQVDNDHQQATIKHEEIKGLMPAMTMPYKVKNQQLLSGIGPGDLVNATLVIVENDAYLTSLKKVGQAPLAPPPPAA